MQVTYIFGMQRPRSLSPADKDFLSLVARAIITNPFSEERSEIDSRIAGKGARSARERQVDRMVRIVGERIAKLEAAGKADVRLHSGESREILSFALLFVREKDPAQGSLWRPASRQGYGRAGSAREAHRHGQPGCKAGAFGVL